jgi:hypothetical protein
MAVLRTFLADVIFYHTFPFALGLKNELDGIAQCTFAAGVGCDVVGFTLGFGSSILHRHGEPLARMAGRSITGAPTKAASSGFKLALFTTSSKQVRSSSTP